MSNRTTLSGILDRGGLCLLWAATLACGSAACGGATTRPGDEVVRPQAKGQTTPVPHAGDAADDPAIWVHPADPERSLILGTDKQGGLIAYNLDGTQRQLVSDGCRPNNVDVLYGVPLGRGRADLAVASVRGRPARGVKVWRIDPDKLLLEDITAGGVLKVLGDEDPYGLCVYRSGRTGRNYFFVNDKNGRIEQHELQDGGSDTVKATLARRLKVKSITEGCVADDELGFFYLAEEQVGIWKFPAEPDAGDKGVLVARIGQNGLAGDVEGLTLYAPPGGKGYLIASSQGNSTFKVYAREGDNQFVLTIDPKGGTIEDVEDTDGIAVTFRGLGRLYPAGLFVAQDGFAKGNQNFKLYDWRDIAQGRLLVAPEAPAPAGPEVRR